MPDHGENGALRGGFLFRRPGRQGPARAGFRDPDNEGQQGGKGCRCIQKKHDAQVPLQEEAADCGARGESDIEPEVEQPVRNLPLRGGCKVRDKRGARRPGCIQERNADDQEREHRGGGREEPADGIQRNRAADEQDDGGLSAHPVRQFSSQEERRGRQGGDPPHDEACRGAGKPQLAREHKGEKREDETPG